MSFATVNIKKSTETCQNVFSYFFKLFHPTAGDKATQTHCVLVALGAALELNKRGGQ